MRRALLVPSIIGLALAACDSAPSPGEVRTGEYQAANASEAPDNQAQLNVAEGETAAAGPSSPAPVLPVASPRSQGGYRLIGTEPFWGGTVSSDEIVYSTPDNQAGEKIAIAAHFEGGREIYSGTYGGQPFVLTLTDGPCSDGMSDNVHALTARLEVQGETRQGCANPRS